MKRWIRILGLLFCVFFALVSGVQALGQATVAWDANTEPTLAGYRTYHGVGSRSYQVVQDVGNQTSDVLSNLDPQTTYYVAATAYDIYGNESDYSEELVIHSILASAGVGGAIYPSGQLVYSSGANQTFDIQPSAGYRISDVMVDGVSIGVASRYTFSYILACHTISVTFVADVEYVADAITTAVTTAHGDAVVNPSNAKFSYQSWQFDGSGDWTETDIDDQPQSFTAKAWVKTTGNGGGQNVVMSTGGYGYGGWQIGANCQVQTEWMVGSPTGYQQVFGARTDLCDNNDHKVVVTLDSLHRVKIYVDDLLDGSGTLSGPVYYQSGQKLMIGRRAYAGSEQWFKGTLSSVSFRPGYVETAKEIWDEYDYSFTQNFYGFEGNGNDYSLYSRDLTVVGAGYTSSGHIGKGLWLDGIGDYAWTPTVQTQEFTFLARVLTQSQVGLDTVGSTGGYAYGGWSFGVPFGQGYVEAMVGALDGFVPVHGARQDIRIEEIRYDSPFNLVALRVKNGVAQIYTDGLPDGDPVSLGGSIAFDPNQPLEIGRRAYPGSNQWFYGELDEVRYITKALSDWEILDIYLNYETVLSLSFEENLDDDSMYQNNGTAFGGAYVNGKFGSALLFDGADDYVLVPLGRTPQKFIVDTWVRPNNSGSQNVIFSLGGGYAYGGCQAGITYGQLKGECMIGSSTGYQPFAGTRTNLADGVHRVSIWVGNNSWKLFVDGEPDGSGSFTDSIFYGPSSDLLVGRRKYPGSEQPYSGLVDEFVFKVGN